MKGDESTYRPSPIGSRAAEELTERADELAGQIGRLTLRCRITEAACACLAALVVASWLTSPSGRSAPAPDSVAASRVVAPEVVTTKLTVMDGAGNVYATLGPADDDAKEGMLTVHDLGTKRRSYVTGGAVTLIDHDDRRRVELAAETQGVGPTRGGISLGDETGLLRMLISASQSESTGVQIRDARGANRAVLGVATNDRPRFEIDEDGTGLKQASP